MNDATIVLMGTAFTIGLVHTLVGPDHYLPFIMMGRAQKWTLARTLTVTTLCGLGHVLSSVALGALGIVAGIALGRLEVFEGMRGELAAWGLIAFGLVYAVWGLRRALRARPHTHDHMHDSEGEHTHEHTHVHDHAHVHGDKARGKSLTPWVLFIVFVLGPCEPLVPLLMFPAAELSALSLVFVTAAFALATLGTMVAIVSVAHLGLRPLRLHGVERFSHAIAGATIAASGLAIHFLGL